MKSEAEITLSPYQLLRLSEELGISAHSIAEALLRLSKTSPLSDQFDRLAVLCNAQAMDIVVLEARNAELESQVDNLQKAHYDQKIKMDDTRETLVALRSEMTHWKSNVDWQWCINQICDALSEKG